MNHRSALVLLLFACLPLLSTSATVDQGGNPFHGLQFYITKNYSQNVAQTLRTSTDSLAKRILTKVLNVPTALWLSSRLPYTDPSDPSDTNTLLGALTDASRQSPIPIVTAVVYNLPNRDCSAEASMGEICCLKNADGSCNFEGSRDCNGGLAQYRHAYIDVIAETVNKFCGVVPMAFIIEPDSLPNMATNLGNAKCNSTGTQASYREGIKYAIEKLHATCPEVSLYLDAAHGRWLGWDDNAEGFVAEVAKLNISEKIRGFSTNVANYNTMGIKCPTMGHCMENPEHECCEVDPCDFKSHNPGFTEINYIEQLRTKLKDAIPDFTPHFVIDTSRNSAKNAPTYCSTWCNPRNTGMGVLPTADTIEPSVVDAYLWVKIPGESDGCTEVLPDGSPCPRFASSCAAPESLGSGEGEPKVPEAGHWFPFQIERLARTAQLSV